MPRLPKPQHLRQNSERRDVGLIAVDGEIVIPEPPTGMLKQVLDSWAMFWRSPLARLVQIDSDLPSLYRLFTLYDERERCYRAVRKERLVMGSQGQMVLNPLYRQMSTNDTEIRNLEDRFGLTPMARLKLGVQMGDAARSLADINAALEDDDDEAADIRLSLAGSASTHQRPEGRPVDGAEPRSRAG